MLAGAQHESLGMAHVDAQAHFRQVGQPQGGCQAGKDGLHGWADLKDYGVPDRNARGEYWLADGVTGFFREGACSTCPEDAGSHTVCARVTEEFLAFSMAAGNDPSTPSPWFGFPALKPGDRWCVCAGRWKEALDAGVAPPVFLRATHERALELIPFEELVRFAADGPELMQ